jgi:hypothetical protein
VPLIVMFLHATANQPAISGVTLCHKKLGLPCYTAEEQLFPLSYIILSYPEEFSFSRHFY